MSITPENRHLLVAPIEETPTTDNTVQLLMPDDFSASTVAAVAQATPLQRIGDPEDLLQTTLYLVEGTDFVTGAVIPVDGGRTIS